MLSFPSLFPLKKDFDSLYILYATSARSQGNLQYFPKKREKNFSGHMVNKTISELTPKQQRFIAEYAIDCNATQAAIRAGFARPGCRDTGRRLLKKPAIQQAVDAELRRRRQAAKYSRDKAEAEYEEARLLALASKQPSAAVMAIRGKARLYGLDRDVIEALPDAGRQLSAEERTQLAAAAAAAAAAARSRLRAVAVA